MEQGNIETFELMKIDTYKFSAEDVTSTCQLAKFTVTVVVLFQVAGKKFRNKNHQECHSELRSLDNVSLENQEGSHRVETSMVLAKKIMAQPRAL